MAPRIGNAPRRAIRGPFHALEVIMSLLGSLVNMLGSGSQGQGDNLALINAVVRMLGNDAPGGGLGGLAAQLQQAGLGDVVGSWIGRGQKLPIPACRGAAGV